MTRIRQARSLAPAMLAAGYVAVFTLLDWASYIRPLQGLNITPWNPQFALAVALLLWNRNRLWLVWLGLLVAEVAVRGSPADWWAICAATGAVALVYGAVARALMPHVDRAAALADWRELLRFAGIVVVGALAAALAYVLSLAGAGLGPQVRLFEAVGRYWVGDAVGLLVILPVLLALADPVRRAALVACLRGWQWWLVAAMTAALLWAVFGRGGQEPFKFFYLLLLPVIWSAARLGVAGAVLAGGWTQVGLIVAVQLGGQRDLTVFELQVLMAVVSMTGLLLGVVVDERARAAAELRDSLRMAAAGQMAAALAHELSQPLTALNGYAQACRMLVADMGETPERARLTEVTQKMVDDARRAGEVVKRLRDFFRTGATRLLPREVPALIREAVQAHEARAVARGVKLTHECADDVPKVLLDPVQIGVVLRNLIANAIDAATTADGGGQVVVRAGAAGGMVHVDVLDNGSGVSAARLPGLFEAAPSDKPGGMGIGLSMSRAIVEAHGGRLWAQAGQGGRFSFTLPVDAEATSGAGRAS